jgi:hypothetical protein
MRCAGAATIHVGLQIRLAESHSRGTAIDDTTHSRAVAFAERRDREQLAYRVA